MFYKAQLKGHVKDDDDGDDDNDDEDELFL